MPSFRCPGVRIGGISCAVPEEVVEVDSFIPAFGAASIAKFKTFAGVQRFRRTRENQTASDLGVAAAEHLLTRHAISRDRIGALVFVSHLTDYRRPATACVIHKRLGLATDCAAFDVNLGCSAYPYGLFAAASLMASSTADMALLVCAESLTKITSPEDRTTAHLFGDCGTATLLCRATADEGLCGEVRTDGSGYRAIIVPAGGFRNRFAPTDMLDFPDGNRRSLHHIHMDPAAVFDFTITHVPALISRFLASRDESIDSYDYLVLHQANLFIMKQIARKLGVSMAKIPVSIDEYGNTSAAAIPLTLCHAFAGSDTPRRIRVLMCGFGVGLSLGVTSAVIDTRDLLPVLTSSASWDEGIVREPSDLAVTTKP